MSVCQSHIMSYSSAVWAAGLGQWGKGKTDIVSQKRDCHKLPLCNLSCIINFITVFTKVSVLNIIESHLFCSFFIWRGIISTSIGVHQQIMWPQSWVIKLKFWRWKPWQDQSQPEFGDWEGWPRALVLSWDEGGGRLDCLIRAGWLAWLASGAVTGVTIPEGTEMMVTEAMESLSSVGSGSGSILLVLCSFPLHLAGPSPAWLSPGWLERLMMSVLAEPSLPQAETGGLVSVSWRRLEVATTPSSRAELNSVRTIWWKNPEVSNNKIIAG